MSDLSLSLSLHTHTHTHTPLKPSSFHHLVPSPPLCVLSGLVCAWLWLCFGEGELARRPSLVPEETRRQRRIYWRAEFFFSFFLFPLHCKSTLCSGCCDVMVNKIGGKDITSSWGSSWGKLISMSVAITFYFPQKTSHCKYLTPVC